MFSPGFLLCSNHRESLRHKAVASKVRSSRRARYVYFRLTYLPDFSESVGYWRKIVITLRLLRIYPAECSDRKCPDALHRNGHSVDASRLPANSAVRSVNGLGSLGLSPQRNLSVSCFPILVNAAATIPESAVRTAVRHCTSRSARAYEQLLPCSPMADARFVVCKKYCQKSADKGCDFRDFSDGFDSYLEVTDGRVDGGTRST